jgi:hypothetical protein
MTKNSYPEKSVVAFVSVAIDKQKIIDILKLSDCSSEIKRSAYVIMRNETGNFHSVINGVNTSGVQADSGRWLQIWDNKIVATCLKNEGMTGKERRFVVFDKLETGIAFLINRIEAKGLFIGEKVGSQYYLGNVETVIDLAVSYWDEWVMGDHSKPTDEFITEFTSMYNQAKLIFS